MRSVRRDSDLVRWLLFSTSFLHPLNSIPDSELGLGWGVQERAAFLLVFTGAWWCDVSTPYVCEPQSFFFGDFDESVMTPTIVRSLNLFLSHLTFQPKSYLRLFRFVAGEVPLDVSTPSSSQRLVTMVREYSHAADHFYFPILDIDYVSWVPYDYLDGFEEFMDQQLDPDPESDGPLTTLADHEASFRWILMGRIRLTPRRSDSKFFRFMSVAVLADLFAIADEESWLHRWVGGGAAVSTGPAPSWVW